MISQPILQYLQPTEDAQINMNDAKRQSKYTLRTSFWQLLLLLNLLVSGLFLSVCLCLWAAEKRD